MYVPFPQHPMQITESDAAPPHYFPGKGDNAEFWP